MLGAQLLLLNPNLINLNVPFAVANDVVSRDRHCTRNGLNDLSQFVTDGICISADAVTSARKCRPVNLIDESSLTVGKYHHPGWMRVALDWFIIKIDPIRREENEQENERDHYIVMERSALVGPENIAANCAPDGVHRQGRRASNRWAGVGSLQVYFQLLVVSNQIPGDHTPLTSGPEIPVVSESELAGRYAIAAEVGLQDLWDRHTAV